MTNLVPPKEVPIMTPEQLLAKTIANAERDKKLAFFNPPPNELAADYIKAWYDND